MPPAGRGASRWLISGLLVGGATGTLATLGGAMPRMNNPGPFSLGSAVGLERGRGAHAPRRFFG